MHIKTNLWDHLPSCYFYCLGPNFFEGFEFVLNQSFCAGSAPMLLVLACLIRIQSGLFLLFFGRKPPAVLTSLWLLLVLAQSIVTLCVPLPLSSRMPRGG